MFPEWNLPNRMKEEGFYQSPQKELLWKVCHVVQGWSRQEWDDDTQIVPFPARRSGSVLTKPFPPAAEVLPCGFLANHPNSWAWDTTWALLELFSLLLLLQATGAPRPGAAIAAWPTVPTSTCSEATIPTTMSPEGRRTRTTPSSGSSGGTTLPQTPGIRWAPKATCPGNWPPCHVRMEIQLLACLFLELF